VRPLGIPHAYKAVYQSSCSSFGYIDAATVDMTLNDLQTKVKVIHFGTNRFLIFGLLCRTQKIIDGLSIIVMVLDYYLLLLFITSQCFTTHYSCVPT